MTSQSPQPSAPLADETEITVCSECLMASCWQGSFMCDSSRNAGTVKATVRFLRVLGRENESYWSKSIASAPAPQPSSTGGDVLDPMADPLAWMLAVAKVRNTDPKARTITLKFSRATLEMWMERAALADKSHDALVKALRGLVDKGWTREALDNARAALKAATGGN